MIDCAHVSFSAQFDDLMAHPTPLMRRLERMLLPTTALESMARQSLQITRRHFGQTMRLFAPLYLSNECVNNCSYCGFSRDNAIFRTTLSIDQVEREARHVADVIRLGPPAKLLEARSEVTDF